MYDLVFITQLPAFYKVNLYNEITKKRKILVIFIGNSSHERASDFVSRDFNFDYYFLSHEKFENASQVKASLSLIIIMSKINYKKVVVSGWNLLVFWVVVFLSRRNKNCMVLESSINDSQYMGLKGLLKKMFLRRVSRVYASGSLHVNLLKKLGFSNEVITTRGVGLINHHSVFFNENQSYERKFLFVGRLVAIKNVLSLIELFNDLPDFDLTIIGDGPLYSETLSRTNSNIKIIRHVENENLLKLMKDSDFLILPSLSEPWGLVVEESLSCRTPVIVSRESGASELVSHGVNGYLFNAHDIKSLKSILLSINNVSYQKMKGNITSNMIRDKDLEQVNSYLS
jgi:glycosyltransferase involved in cell wall biosynthesis